MEHLHAEGRHDIAQEAARRQQHNAQPAVPPGYGPDRFGLVALVDHIHNIGSAHGAASLEKQHGRHIERKDQRVAHGL